MIAKLRRQYRLKVMKKMMTVKETVESKGEQYWEPDVGKSLKCEVHPLACAGTIVVTWMNDFAFTRKAQF